MSVILVTGGAGYIGSHTVLQLLQAGHAVVVFDNLSNSKPEAMARVRVLAAASLGQAPEAVPLSMVEGDIRDAAALAAVFSGHPDISAVIHFAGLKAVGESVAKPLMYYDNNVVGTVRLLEAMAAAGVHRLVFSSSATVYGDPHAVPIREDFPLSATNAYGASKLHIEDMLRDLHRSAPERWQFAILRYFNPVGAHESGRIGEDPNGIPNNLMPFIAQVASGRLERLRVFGSDYPTPDGTGVRDYIHVVDLARGHLQALERLARGTAAATGEATGNLVTVNLGTGSGYSVLDMLRAFELAAGRPIAHELVARRPGDVAQCYADPALAERELGWRAERDQADMCRDHWHWQKQNPAGYA
ncbi:UDP-glucose 4-epimerase GalE [Amnimonas aquatica]|uniref:UDP-glucose 4-epimerase n=1 Tax=Amnimonas aquatica TaxID=2094561 RepID=A0A2P6ARA5_9GAMM|nr:UDP-glucose 4-epimerase GalE [Amnimonas aquatica]PQA35470.1 UDP-glucose 4-epimerase GalE [Amnimonas aquatica]